jgi:hypothetical protein
MKRSLDIEVSPEWRGSITPQHGFHLRSKRRWTLASMRGQSGSEAKPCAICGDGCCRKRTACFQANFFRAYLSAHLHRYPQNAERHDFLDSLVARFWSGTMEPLERMLHWDKHTNRFPIRLLVKLGYCEHVSKLEVRSHFLDQELVESLPPRTASSLESDDSKAKLILRSCRSRPATGILRARKRGFSVPLGNGGATRRDRTIREGLLPLHPCTKRPFLNEGIAAELLDEHQAGRANHASGFGTCWC